MQASGAGKEGTIAAAKRKVGGGARRAGSYMMENAGDIAHKTKLVGGAMAGGAAVGYGAAGGTGAMAAGPEHRLEGAKEGVKAQFQADRHPIRQVRAGWHQATHPEEDPYAEDNPHTAAAGGIPAAWVAGRKVRQRYEEE